MTIYICKYPTTIHIKKYPTTIHDIHGISSFTVGSPDVKSWPGRRLIDLIVIEGSGNNGNNGNAITGDWDGVAGTEWLGRSRSPAPDLDFLFALG